MFKKITSFFKKLGSGLTNPNTINVFHTAAVDIQLLAPGLVLALQEAGNTDASAEVVDVTHETVVDLGLLSQLLSQAQAGDTSVVPRIIALLNSMKANLSGLLVAGHIKNPQTVQTVTNCVNAFVAEIDVVLSLIPVPAAK